MSTHDYQMYAGDSRVQEFHIVDDAGSPVDVSSAGSITYHIAVSVGAPVPLTVKTLGAGVSVAGNVVSVALEPADTLGLDGTYYHELQIVDVFGHSFTAVAGPVRLRGTRIE